MAKDLPIKVKNRYMILLAGMAIQFCAGTLYMWSVYNADVAAYLLWDKTNTGFTVPFMLTFFVVGIIIGGRIMDKIGPRMVCVVGSIIMSVGILISSQVTSDCRELIWLTYGIIGGTGVGIVYTCTVSPIQKWFFDKKGFATGMMVMAFGLSMALFTPVAWVLLAAVGVPSTFMIFGVAFMIICIPASLLIINPPPGFVIPKTSVAATQKQYTPKEMLRTKAFYLLFFFGFFITSAFFVLNPQLVSFGMERGLTKETATMVLIVMGISSACGRLAITWTADIKGRVVAMLAIFTLTLLGVLLLIPAQGLVYFVCIAMIAFAYGGVAGLYAIMTSDNFGTKFMGSNYGIVLIGFGLSAPSFVLLSAKFPVAESNMIFVICAAACLANLVCVILLRKYAIADYRSKKVRV